MSINEAILKRRYSLFLPCADNSQEQAAETLLIPVEEHNEVKKSVAKMFEQRRPSRTALTASESPSSTAHQGYASSDDGRVVVEVQPEEQTEGGPRRSTRKRNAIAYDS